MALLLPEEVETIDRVHDQLRQVRWQLLKNHECNFGDLRLALDCAISAFDYLRGNQRNKKEPPI